MIPKIRNDLNKITENYTAAPIFVVLFDAVKILDCSKERYVDLVKKLSKQKDLSTDIKNIIHSPPLICYKDLNRSWDTFSSNNIHDNYYLLIHSLNNKQDRWYQAGVYGDGRLLSLKFYAYRKDKSIIKNEEGIYEIKYFVEPSAHIPYISVSYNVNTFHLLDDDNKFKGTHLAHIEEILNDFQSMSIPSSNKKGTLVLDLNIGSLSNKLTYNAELWHSIEWHSDEIVAYKHYIL